MIISATKRFNYRFKIQPKFNHRFNQILNLYKKTDSKQKVLRGALIKRRDFLWIRKMLFQCRKKESCLLNKTFSLKRKNNVWGSFPQPIEILFTFWRIFGDSNAAKRGGNRGGGGWLLKIPWDLPCIRVLWKLLKTFGWILKNYRDALPLRRLDQLLRSAKNEVVFHLIQPGSDTYRMISNCKSVCVLSRGLLLKILGSLNKFYEIWN